MGHFSKWVLEGAPDVFAISNCRDVSWLTLPFLPERVCTVSIAHHDVGADHNPVRHYFPYIDLAVGVSPQIRERLAVMAGLDRDRCRYIPYGVDVLAVEQAAAKVRAGGVPRFTHRVCRPGGRGPENV